jgi:hypothetical protein
MVSNARRLRLTLLFTMLGLLLFALWYDYEVARPAVEQAYESIAEINLQINTSPRAMTGLDVRQALGKLPAGTFTVGPYQVEVYAWVAGLPFRSHEVYVVYFGRGQNKTVRCHYKYVLPVDELIGAPAVDGGTWPLSVEPLRSARLDASAGASRRNPLSARSSG